MTLKYSEYIIPGPDRIHKICHSYPQQEEEGGQGILEILQYMQSLKSCKSSGESIHPMSHSSRLREC